MQLNKMIKTNLFNELSDKEQEVVAGGTVYSGVWGSVVAEAGKFQYIKPDGTATPAATWTKNSFSYGGTTYSW